MSDATTIANRLATLVSYPTIAPDPGMEPDGAASEAFNNLHRAMREFYPTVFAVSAADELGNFGRLLRIPGRTSTQPVVMMAHQDVVPTSSDLSGDGWPCDPFAKTVKDGRVFGRGTLDDKGALMLLLEAVESLLSQGWEPERDLYLLLGADEEKHGRDAVEATKLLESRGVVPYLVLDEGGAVASEAFPSVEEDLAVVGVAEKGVMTVRLTVTDSGGHASTPPFKSAPGILARALARIEQRPFPAALHPVAKEMLEAVAPKMHEHADAIVPKAVKLGRPFAALLARLSPEMAAMVRTTVAITQLEGSPGVNVLATKASAVLNIRIAVGSNIAEATDFLRKVISDKRVSIRVEEASEPSPVSPRDDRFAAVADAVRLSFGVSTVPYIMMAASDARHVARIAPAVYRFSPLRMDKAQRGSIHGIGENVEIDSLVKGVAFYRALLTGKTLGPALP